MPITALAAALIALLFVALSLRVISYRGTAKVSLGDGDNVILQRRIRAQANCAEYAPLGLILLGLAESLPTPQIMLWGLGGILVLGRFMHGIGMTRAKPNVLLRLGGMNLTLMAILGLAVVLLARVLFP